MYNSHRLIAGRPWVAVIHKTSKTAPQSSPKAGKILEKRQLKPLKSLKQLPNHSETAGKIPKKVAETAEIPKTAPQPQRNSRKNSGKKQLKSLKSPKQLKNIACYLYLQDAISSHSSLPSEKTSIFIFIICFFYICKSTASIFNTKLNHHHISLY